MKKDLPDSQKIVSQVVIELKMFNGIFNRVDPQSTCPLPAKGYWYPPTFLTGVTASHRVAQEEIFGPVLAVMTFRTPEEAVERANNTPYGLSAGV